MKSDVEELMPRLLPIELGTRSADLDLSGPPRNPQEYLRQVQSVRPLLTAKATFVGLISCDV